MMAHRRSHLAVLAVTGLSIILATDVLWARKPSTPEDRAKAVRLTRQLETDLLGDAAPEARQWLIVWLAKVPDITVKIRDLLGPIPSTDHPFASEVFTQMIFSNAAFIIEHPDAAKDEVAAQTAGVVGALTVYEVIVRAHPEARLEFLDDLLRKRDEGKLSEYVRAKVPTESGK